MAQNVLKGKILITDNIDFVRETLYSNIPDVKVISLDENNSIPLDHPNVLGGQCLLPPMDALIAEADGDEQLFDISYFNHFADPVVEQFVIALMAFLFNCTGTLILYIPDVKTVISKKLIDMFWMKYGIGMGIVGCSDCVYDESCVPIWLGYLYSVHILTPLNMLYLYPNEALIPQQIMDQLLIELVPYGDNYQSKVDFILDLRSKIKVNQKIKIPIYQITE